MHELSFVRVISKKNFPQPRRDVRARPEGSTRQPPISGTNNIPIGVRRGAGPPSNPPLSLPSDGLLNSPHTVFNPDARPPPSTLINPGKSRELLEKESYERVGYYQTAAFITSNFTVISPKDWLFVMIDLDGCHPPNFNLHVAAHP